MSPAKQEDNEQAWLEERRLGIGGSDAGHLDSLPPYGCRRRLWYDKSGVPRDHEPSPQEQRYFDRGHELEPLIAQKYNKQSQRSVRRLQARENPERPWERVNIDRQIVGNHGGPAKTPGVLECKSAGRDMYKIFEKEGLSNGYIAQVQWALMVTGYEWGSYAVLNTDTWELAWFDVIRDEDLIKYLRTMGKQFWETVSNETLIPDRLDPRDKRCQGCWWRTSCQGAAMIDAMKASDRYDPDDIFEMPELAEQLSSLYEFKGIEKSSKKEIEALKFEIEKAMGDKPRIQAGGFVVAKTIIEGRVTLRTADLKKEQPAVYDKYKKVGNPYSKLNGPFPN